LNNFILNFAFLLLAISSFLKQKLLKQVGFLTFAIVFCFYGIAQKNSLFVFWGIIVFLINLYRLLEILRKKKSATRIDEEIIDIYNNVFPELSKEEFGLIWEKGKILKSRQGEILCKQGIVQGDIFLLLEGKVGVFRDNRKIAELTRGNFVAEKGYVKRKPASADVVAETDIEYVLWKRIDFERLKEENPQLFSKINDVLQKGYSH